MILENNLPVRLEDLESSFSKFAHVEVSTELREIYWLRWHDSILGVAKHFAALSTFVDSSKRTFSMEELIQLLHADVAYTCKGNPHKAEARALFSRDVCKWLYKNRKKWIVLFY